MLQPEIFEAEKPHPHLNPANPGEHPSLGTSSKPTKTLGTLPETNIAPENEPLEKEIPFWKPSSLGAMLVLGRVASPTRVESPGLNRDHPGFPKTKQRETGRSLAGKETYGKIHRGLSEYGKYL